MQLKEAIEDLRSWVTTADSQASRRIRSFILPLCDMTLERLDQGHTPIWIKREDILVGVKRGARTNDEAHRTRLRRIANDAFKFVLAGEHRLNDHVQLRGHEHAPYIDIDNEGGHGNKALYCIKIKRLEMELDDEDAIQEDEDDVAIHGEDTPPKLTRNALVPVAQPASDSDARSQTSTLTRIAMFGRRDHLIRYIMLRREDIRLTWKGRLLLGKSNNHISRWRQKMVAAYIVLCFLVIAAMLALAFLSMNFTTKPLNPQHISLIISTAVIVLGTYRLGIRPFMALNSHRMMLLDEAWLKKNQYPAVLEKIDDPDDDDGALLILNRYQSACGVCGSTVILRTGEPSWPGRIIGACVNSPSEHVYTFDRFTLIGVPLRPPMVGMMEV